MKKLPKCSYCGGPHYGYACWRNPKRKSAFKSHFKRLERTQKKKMGNLVSKRENDRKRVVERLDEVVSRYVRQYFADKNGICDCYTCGKRLPWKGMDCGHCISRRYMATRFELDNMRPQCQNCNRTLRGNYGVYYPKLKKELGDKRYDELWQLARSDKKISTVELKDLLEKYENLLKSLKK